MKRINIIKFLNTLTEKQRLIVLSVIVGFCSGIAAVVLKLSIEGIRHLLTNWINTGTDSLWYLCLPGIGMLLSLFFVKLIAKEEISHGITRILYAISRKESKLSKNTIWTPLVASALTIGFGGSVGAEAPIVHSGASIGSSIAQKLNLNYKNITLLLACGAAGSLAGIFKAPLAGIVFTIEILMFDLTLSSIVPLLISSVTAILIPYFFLGQTVAFTNETVPFSLYNIPYYLILGVFCGLMSLYFIRTTLKLEGKIKKIKNAYIRLLISALSIGLLVFLFPPLYGEGYSSLSLLLNNEVNKVFDGSIYGSISNNSWFVLVFFVSVMFLKVVSMSFTNAGGGVGGTFGPTLVIGGICGFITARAINLTHLVVLPESNFALVGMGGLMAGVMYAPLTGIFLIAEITGGYNLLIPLMITSAVSFLLINRFESNSIYTKRLAIQGDLITHNKDQAILTQLSVAQLLETNFLTIRQEQTLGELVLLISNTNRNLFPVVSDNNKFIGIVLLDDVRGVMFDRNQYSVLKISNFMKFVDHPINIDDNMAEVMKKFNLDNSWNLPVIDNDNNYLGFISKSKMFGAYREQLINFTQ